MEIEGNEEERKLGMINAWIHSEGETGEREDWE